MLFSISGLCEVCTRVTTTIVTWEVVGIDSVLWTRIENIEETPLNLFRCEGVL